jgi:crotonobetainyl-CoA:carnitine CoA-transferase CaiB-like acyl-CoA transferase
LPRFQAANPGRDRAGSPAGGSTFVLEGMQVVDLSHGIAGPVVGMFLADFGAEVITVKG